MDLLDVLQTVDTMSGDELSAIDRVSLGLSRSYYAASRVLRLSKLRDLLAAGVSITPGAPVWLLGSCYSCPPGATEAQEEEVRGLEGRQRAFRDAGDLPGHPAVAGAAAAT